MASVAKAQKGKGTVTRHGAVREGAGLAYFPPALHGRWCSALMPPVPAGERAGPPTCHACRSAAQQGAPRGLGGALPAHCSAMAVCVSPQLHGHPAPRPVLSTLRDSGSWALLLRSPGLLFL